MNEQMKTYGGILAGALLIAIGLYFFWAPADLAGGGVSGLAIVCKALLPVVPIGVLMFILDMIMFTIGFIALGKSFGMKSLLCSISVSVMMMIMEWIWPNVKMASSDQFVILLFGALLMGLGQAIIFNVGASSGGTDIIAKIITKYVPINIGMALMIADMVVVLLATGVFGIEKGLYAILGVIIVSNLIDYLIEGFNVQKYVTIIPSDDLKGDEINHYVLKDLELSTTLYTAQGGYSHKAKSVITTVMGRKEFVELRRELLKLDPLAFMTVQNMHEVIGKEME